MKSIGCLIFAPVNVKTECKSNRDKKIPIEWTFIEDQINLRKNAIDSTDR